MSRLEALQATQNFAPGTVGYGVNQAIDLLYNGVTFPGGSKFGGFGDLFSAQVGTLFKDPEMQALMSRPATDQAAQLEVARRELQYWQNVFDNPNSSTEDKTGARIALNIPAEDRAQVQRDFADGRSFWETAPVLVDFFGDLWPIGKDLFWEFVDYLDREISDFTNRILKSFNQAMEMISPLVLDLDSDGIELSSLQNSQAFFDLDTDGFAERTGWVKPDDGLLAFDRNNNGRIDDITELFGNDKTDGFIILKQLDINNDNIIDNRDAQFASLRVWKDLDSDGFTDIGELQSLATWNIRSINLNYRATNLTNEGNRISSTSTYTLSDGNTRQIVDVWFSLDQTNTVYTGDYFDLKTETLFLPTLRGYGQLPDLYISMSQDPILLGMMRNFVQFSTTNYSQFHAQVVNQIEALLYRWAGVEAIAVNSRGANIDARQLTFLEKLTGESFDQIGWGANPGPQASKKLKSIWNDLMREMLGRVLVQGPMRNLFPETSYNLNKDTLESPSTLSSILNTLRTNVPTDPSQRTFYWNLAIVALDSFEDRFSLSQEQYDAQLNQTLTLAGFTGGVNLLRQPEFVQSFAGNIFGTDNNDVLTGSSGNDRIYGGSGNDTITGNAGNDVIDGGLGDDRVNGGDGDDVIKVGLGIDIVDGGNGKDTLDLDISNLTTNQIINNPLNNTSLLGSISAIDFEAIKLTTGSGNDTIIQASIVNGSVYRSDDEFNSGSGNDTLNPGLGFSDEVNGGEGTDILILDYSIGDTGEFMQFELTTSNATGISGSAGRTITGGTGWLDSIVFSGIDQFNITGTQKNDQITTWSGSDLIIGGKGNDVMDGSSGSDTYRYQLGDGDDTINDTAFQNDGSIDKLELSGTGLIASNVIVNRVGTTDDLKITFKNSIAGSIVLKNQLRENYSYGIENLVFSDGTTWNESQMWGSYLGLGADTNDTLLGTPSNDLIIGGKGNDVMDGSSGSDTYRYQLGDGDDTINDTAFQNDGSIDKLELSGTGLIASNVIVNRVGTTDDLKITFKNSIAGSIVLKNQLRENYSYGIENLVFSDGTTWNESQMWGSYLGLGADTNDTLLGTPSNDLIIGGKGNDVMDGSSGSDTYRYQLGDGDDTINDTAFQNDGSIDKLELSGTGLIASNVIVNRVGTTDDLKITFKNSIAGSIVLKNQLRENYSYGIENLVFSDGTTWNESQMWGSYLGLGADTNDTLLGTPSNDLIIGGKGNDVMDGSSGSDTYRYQLGDGDDTINDTAFQNDGSIDKLELSGTGLIASNVIVNRVGTTDDLKITFKNSIAGSIVLKNQLRENYSYGIENLVFSDGTTWNESQMWGSYLGLGADTNDTLLGTPSNDLIIGGKGNDVMDGSSGSDTYRYQLGDGDDTINDTAFQNDGSIDKLELSGTGLIASNVIVNRVGTTDDLKITFKNSIAGSIVLKNQLRENYSYGIENLVFSDGTTWNESQMWGSYLGLGADTNDTLLGTPSNDLIIGGKGNDVMDGSSGSDTYRYQLGDGDDTINDTAFQNDGSIDKLELSGTGLIASNVIVNRVGTTDDLKITFKNSIAGSIVLKNQLRENYSYGIENLVFSDGTTWNESQMWGSYLGLGADTNDTLLGTPSNDLIIGGKGNDVMDGSSGSDTYRYQLGDGDDTINDTAFQNDGSIDKLELSGTGLIASNVIVNRVGTTDDLKITFKNSIAGSIVLKNQLRENYSYGIENLVFSDGTTWNESQMWGSYLGLGADTNNTLLGTSGNDLIIGTTGSDRLQGAAATRTPGYQEIDTLTGNSSADLFVLGTRRYVFYDDSNYAQARWWRFIQLRNALQNPGLSDYAIIQDFNPTEGDRIQLKGNATQYQLGTSPIAALTGTAIFLTAGQQTPELIGIIQGTAPASLSTNYFTYV